MTYQVLARKWRPKDFASLVGQEHVVRALTHALEQQRLHHAYLFTGTRGVGKTTLSRIFAKALNCETGITATPCGVCGACQAIDAGRFVDYVEMDAASNRGVDEMAALLERAVYAPVDARFKVYMIDEVHMLTNHAFNAMLKTLEEPPAHVKFILATTDPQKIPVTVLSRCLQFNLKQMPATHIVSHLEKVLAEEGVACEPQALRLLARAAEGSMRDALSLTDQAIAYAGGEVGEEAVRGMLGALDQSYLVRLLDALAANDGAAVLAVADEMALRSLSFSTALQDLSSLLHRIAWAQAAPGSVMDEWPEAVDIRRFAGALAPEDVQLYYQIATIGRSELGLAPDEYAGFTMALLRMLAFRPAVSGAAPAPPAARGSGEGAARGAGAVPAPATKVADLSTAPPGRTTAVAPPPDPAAIAPLHTAEHAVQPDTAAVLAAVPASASGPILPVSAAADAFAAGSVSSDLAARIPGSPETPAPATPLERPVPPPVASSARRPSGGPASAALEMLRGAGPRGASVRPQVPAPAPSRPRVAEPAISEPPGGAGSAPPGSTSVAPWEDMPPDDYPAYGSAQDESFVGLQEMPPGFDDMEEPSAASAHGREAYLAARATPAAAALPEQPLSPAVSLAPLGFDGAWPALAVTLALKGISYQLAFNSELMALDDTILKLRVPVPQYADGAQVAKLKAALIERLGQQLDVQVEVGPARRTAAAAAAAAQALRQQQAERSIEQDPFVQSLIREFDATIVPGSIRPLPPPAAGQGPTPPVANF